MKKSAIVLASVLAGALIIPGCSNCDEAVQKEKDACEQAINARVMQVADSLNADWQTKMDAVMQELEQAKAAAAGTKSTGTSSKTETTKPKDPKSSKMSGEGTETNEKTSKMSGEGTTTTDKKKSKMGGN